MFVDRDTELSLLEKMYQSDQAELFILYGRRRVGKTELLQAFCRGKAGLFFIATMSSDRDQLASFSQQVYSLLHGSASEQFSYPTWESALDALKEIPGRPVIVIDEFTYLIDGNKAFPSILQKAWDASLRHTRLMLILCGSYIGMMETEVLGYRAPLYGRRTGSWLLEPLTLRIVPAFYPRYSSIENMEAWAVLGGMPYYLAAFSDSKDIFTNIRDQILDRSGLLFAEPRLLLLEELREPRNYFSILRAIAGGRRRLSEIVTGAGVGDSSATSRYLDILQQMRLVVRQVPVTESQPEKSKKGLYQIKDAFLRFWFRYVHPYQNSLDLGLADTVLRQTIQPTFGQYVSFAFEEAAIEFVAFQAQNSGLAFLPERIGRWWAPDQEIDLVAINSTERQILTGECKWSIHPVGLDVMDDLKQKTTSLLEGKNWQTQYYLFSRSGFTPALQEKAASEGVQLIDIKGFFS